MHQMAHLYIFYISKIKVKLMDMFKLGELYSVVKLSSMFVGPVQDTLLFNLLSKVK